MIQQNENVHISAIVAMDLQDGIGKNGGMPWHIPEDFKHFKEYTKNKTCIMGRRTYEDILSYKKKPTGDLLPNRKCVVLSRAAEEYKEKNTYDNLIFVDKDISWIRKNVSDGLYGDNICIIGGASLFEEFADMYDEISITEILKDFECDIFVDRADLTYLMDVKDVKELETNTEYAVNVLIFEKHKYKDNMENTHAA